MVTLDPIHLPAGSSAAEVAVETLAAPLFVYFEHASTATVYLDGAYIGAVVTSCAGGGVFNVAGAVLTVYRAGDEATHFVVVGREKSIEHKT